MKVLQVRGQRFLSIRVVDPQEYIKRSGFFLRLLNAANAKTFGSPINISANSLKMDFDELVRVLAEAFERHKAGL